MQITLPKYFLSLNSVTTLSSKFEGLAVTYKKIGAVRYYLINIQIVFSENIEARAVGGHR